MTLGDLFTGIGGFSLAAQWMGWDITFQVERDPFCQKVLTKNFPHVKRYGDIREFDGTPYRGTIDILTGGFPCQPYSTAGKRKGKNDDRHLWPENFRVIREIRPTCIVGENVYGLVNWSGGLVFDEVQADLEAEGFEVSPVILPAVCVDACHRRDRIWFVAHSHGNRSQTRIQPQSNNRGQEISRIQPRATFNFEGYTAPRICRKDDGIPYRLDRLRGLGNAIVPQVAFEIFKAIEQTMKSDVIIP